MEKYRHLYGDYFIRNAYSIWDEVFMESLVEAPWKEWLLKDIRTAQAEYAEVFYRWITSSKNNFFLGLNTFPYRYLINGTTQSLDEFHYRHKGRRIRMLRGEYPYHYEVLGDSFDFKIDFIDTGDALRSGDAIVISCPLSATGDKHPQMDLVLNQALSLGIPVSVDCAFFGTCSAINVDLSHPSIETVAFSLTKGLSTGNFRSGIEFSRIQSGHLSVQNFWKHNLHGNAKIGIYLMERFSPDYLFNKYRAAQLQVCEIYGLIPTQCIHLALGGEGWEYFDRDRLCNRVCIRRAVKEEYKKTKQKPLDALLEAT